MFDSTEEAVSYLSIHIGTFKLLANREGRCYSHICKHSTISSHFSSGGVNIQLHSIAIMDLRCKRPRRRKMKENRSKFSITYFDRNARVLKKIAGDGAKKLNTSSIEKICKC